MLFFTMFTWWYGQGWRQMVRTTNARAVKVAHIFSVPILLRTLFAPWRRIVTYPGAGLDAKLRAIGDNLVSRVIGFTVRICVLIAAGVVMAGTMLTGVVAVIAWPLVPPAIPFLVIKGFIG